MIRHLIPLLLLAVPVLAGPRAKERRPMSAEAFDAALRATLTAPATEPEPLSAPGPTVAPGRTEWRITRAVESPSARKARRANALFIGTVIIVLLGTCFVIYGAWYDRRVLALKRAAGVPLLSGPGHVSRPPPTPAA